ncbi:hypothetical protein [Nitrobacter winogradskyi]|uniref:ATPase n=2 Tax=Nitrobacter winogradskyi TaxID=913 RepID=A0ACC6AHD6_NITWI|nr:hypothetical protein [Nitrobacter winogradskyi]MCP1998275.1 putative ATPase [Nitrobacter winogradskyi]GEC15887.1 hypothetical protein NWI01_17790 [Nitrobacter winogradskyi]
MAAILAFFASTMGRYLIIGGLVLAAVVGIRQSGINSERRKCEAAAHQRAVEIMQRDIAIGQLQQKLDNAISAEQSEQERVDREVQEKLEAELARRPIADQCLLSEPDARRLR